MKNTKFHLVAKSLGLKTVALLNDLKAQGHTEFTGANQNVTEEQVIVIKEALVGINEKKTEEAEEMSKYNKGVFIGVVKNNDGTFTRLKMIVEMSKLEGIEMDLIEKGVHDTIFGAEMELKKDLDKDRYKYYFEK